MRHFLLSLLLLATLAGCSQEPTLPPPPPPETPPAVVAPPTAPAPPFPAMAATTLHVGRAEIHAEIAATQAEQEHGLMDRSSLGDNDGMIFLLPQVGPATFWMKDTLLPLSIAFLDRDGVILEVHDMKPLDTTITRSTSDRVAYALEMNLHWFTLNGVKPGDRVTPPPDTLASARP